MGKKTTTIKTACIAGVSGGPDSMAMLHALRQRIVCVCHVNYHKRPTANRDQNIVKQYCKQNQIPLAILNVNKSVYQKYQTINNFQSKARIIRFDFFAKIAQKYNARFVITAHHFNDFIETAMIQKQRKVRTLFLGIKEWNLYKNVIVFHPFLSFSKSSLIAYCQHHKIPFGIDETNANDNYQRNRIRKKMLTWSATKLKQTYRNILKFNKTHAKKQTQVDNHLLKWFANNFAIKYYLTIPKVLRYYVIYSTLSCNNISRISHNKIQLIDQFITNAKINSQLRLGKKRIIVKAKNNIEFI